MPPRRRPVIERLFDRVTITHDCWLWTGAVTKKGYGHIGGEGRQTLQVHIVSYEYFRGPVPDGLELDHRCKVRNCVRPAHLEPVTHAVNLERSDTSWSDGKCSQGHDITHSDNIYTGPDGKRRCRPCKRAKQARWKARRGQKVSI